jgi:hypothetical protein
VRFSCAASLEEYNAALAKEEGILEKHRKKIKTHYSKAKTLATK